MSLCKDGIVLIINEYNTYLLLKESRPVHCACVVPHSLVDSYSPRCRPNHHCHGAVSIAHPSRNLMHLSILSFTVLTESLRATAQMRHDMLTYTLLLFSESTRLITTAPPEMHSS